MPEQDELRRSPEVPAPRAEAPEVALAEAPEVAAGVRGGVAPVAAAPEVGAPAAAEQAAAESAEERLLREVSEILGEDLREVYEKLPADRQRAFDESGDELVREIARAAQAGRQGLPARGDVRRRSLPLAAQRPGLRRRA